MQLESLENKHYDTRIRVWLDGDHYESLGQEFLISISGLGVSPSYRELEREYYPEEGMNHIESEQHLFLAQEIIKALSNL